VRLILAYSRREIAEMIGVSTETAIRLLGRLRSKQLIKSGGRDLLIPDPSRLARIANHGSIAA
jgi:CRP-like cAMP-binding protein